MWRYRSRGRWRGGRPRVSGEIRGLIARMARENFLWGAPRIHGKLLMLGFNISPATVSRYLPAPSRRPRESWRTFLRNQASAFGQYSEERSDGYARPQCATYSADLVQSAAAQIAARQQLPTLNAESVSLRSAQRDRGVTHGARRIASAPSYSNRVLEDHSGTALPIRSPPISFGVAMFVAARDSRRRVSAVAPDFVTAVHDRADTSNSSATLRAFPATFRVSARGSGFEKGTAPPQPSRKPLRAPWPARQSAHDAGRNLQLVYGGLRYHRPERRQRASRRIASVECVARRALPSQRSQNDSRSKKMR